MFCNYLHKAESFRLYLDGERRDEFMTAFRDWLADETAKHLTDGNYGLSMEYGHLLGSVLEAMEESTKGEASDA